MQVPPGYAPPRPKNNSLSIILIVVSLSCILLCAVGGFFAFKQGMAVVNNIAPVATCTIDITAVRDAVVKYANEKGRYPSAENWQDELREYVRADIADKAKETSGTPFKFEHMNVDGQWGCITSEAGQPRVWSSFVYNKAIAGKKPSEVVAPDSTVAIFEAPGSGTNESYEYGTKKLGQGPKLMGEHREWAKISLSGDAQIGGTTIKSRSRSGSSSAAP